MSKRIVLVDFGGEVLFSGFSVADRHEEAAPPPTEDALDTLDALDAKREGGGEGAETEEPCPETLRSPVFESGFYPAVRGAKSARDGRAA